MDSTYVIFAYPYATDLTRYGVRGSFHCIYTKMLSLHEATKFEATILDHQPANWQLGGIVALLYCNSELVS